MHVVRVGKNCLWNNGFYYYCLIIYNNNNLPSMMYFYSLYYRIISFDVPWVHALNAIIGLVLLASFSLKPLSLDLCLSSALGRFCLLVLGVYMHVHDVPHIEQVGSWWWTSGHMEKHGLDEVSDFEDVSRVTRASPNTKLCVFHELLHGSYCPWHYTNLFMQAHLCCVVFTTMMSCCSLAIPFTSHQ